MHRQDHGSQCLIAPTMSLLHLVAECSDLAQLCYAFASFWHGHNSVWQALHAVGFPGAALLLGLCLYSSEFKDEHASDMLCYACCNVHPAA